MYRSRISVLILVTVLVLTSACGGAAPATPTAAPTALPSKDATAVPAAATPAAATPTQGGIITVSFGINSSDTLNQHTSTYTASRMVARHVLDTLTVVNPKDGSVNPGLATSWEVSADGKTFTFKLRQDAKFHDGTPFNAAAVKFNFDYTTSPDIKHGFAWSALGGDNYEKTEVVDDYTVKVSFKAPYSAFPTLLSDGGLGIDSPTAMQQAGDDYGVKTLVGTGPYKFKEWVNGDHITLVRNEDYAWGSPVYTHSGAGYVDQIIFRDVKDVSTRVAALEAGELQFATVTEPFVTSLQSNKDLQVLVTPKAGTTRMYQFNFSKAPTDDIRVRQAIIYAIDRAALIGLPAWSGIGKPGIAPLPSSMVPNADLSSLQQYDLPYDPEKAKALLDEAGWKTGSDGIREKDGQKLILDFVTMDTTISQVEPIDQMLRQVGAKLNIRTGDFNFWIATCQKLDYHMTLMSDSGSNAFALVEEFWHSTSNQNWQAYKNAKADEYIEKASAATTSKELWDNLFAAMAETMKDAQGVNAWEQQYVYGASAKVQGVFFNEIGYPFFYDTWIAK